MKKFFQVPKAQVLSIRTEKLICGSGAETPIITPGQGDQPVTPQSRSENNGTGNPISVEALDF